MTVTSRWAWCATWSRQASSPSRRR